LLPLLGFSPDLPARFLAPALSFSAGCLSRFVLPKTFLIQDPPCLFATPPPARLRTQNSCIRDPNSILVFFHFPSYLTCPWDTGTEPRSELGNFKRYSYKS